MLKSLGLHLLALALLLLIPAGPLRDSARAKELDVVFHRPEPRIEGPVPEVPLPRGQATAALPRPERTARPAPSVVPQAPAPAGPQDLAQGTPDVPPLPEGLPEAPPEPPKAKPGILAFRDELANLSRGNAAPRLGAQARYGNAQEARQTSSPSTLTTGGPGSSGGIDPGSLNRNVGGNGRGGNGDGIEGLPVGRATSAIASIGGGERPLASGGPGPSRTDEEIQIVFDRYKASFYRLYNRELRNDPTLQGQMVLRLTIEPDGSVSMCVLQSTDMNAPGLATQVVDRVLTINFGAKEGVQALTIVYPIDFLPAA
jgi:hypothetical protein